jgi:hypothetical protein
MQRRQLWLLNIVLAVFALLMGDRLLSGWREDRARYAALEKRSAAAVAVVIQPAAASLVFAGGEIVARNPFTSDRNNDRPQVAQAVQSAPLPTVIGTMRLGEEYEALMSESAQPGGEKFHRVKLGGSIGPYAVTEIRDEAVVVELGGQKTTLNVYQSARAVRQAAPPAAAAAPPPQAPTVVSTGVPPTTPAQSSATATQRGGDLTPPFPGVIVTIEGNRKKFERPTAFGPQIWYEDIK